MGVTKVCVDIGYSSVNSLNSFEIKKMETTFTLSTLFVIWTLRCLFCYTNLRKCHSNRVRNPIYNGKCNLLPSNLIGIHAYISPATSGNTMCSPKGANIVQTVYWIASQYCLCGPWDLSAYSLINSDSYYAISIKLSYVSYYCRTRIFVKGTIEISRD